MKCNLLEHKQVDGIADTSRIGLTSHAKRTLLADYDIRNTEAGTFAVCFSAFWRSRTNSCPDIMQMGFSSNCSIVTNLVIKPNSFLWSASCTS